MRSHLQQLHHITNAICNPGLQLGFAEERSDQRTPGTSCEEGELHHEAIHMVKFPVFASHVGCIDFRNERGSTLQLGYLHYHHTITDCLFPVILRVVLHSRAGQVVQGRCELVLVFREDAKGHLFAVWLAFSVGVRTRGHDLALRPRPSTGFVLEGVNKQHRQLLHLQDTTRRRGKLCFGGSQG